MSPQCGKKKEMNHLLKEWNNFDKVFFDRQIRTFYTYNKIAREANGKGFIKVKELKTAVFRHFICLATTKKFTSFNAI